MTDAGRHERGGRRLRRPDARGGPRAHPGRPRGAPATWSGEPPHEMTIGRCQRSDDIIEPRLKTQWFIDVKPMAERAMQAVRERRTRFVPAALREGLLRLAREHPRLEHQPPTLVGPPHPSLVLPRWPRHRHRRSGRPDALRDLRLGRRLVQDADTFDTWFSSGLWPFSTLGWPDETPDLATYYPTTVMETGHDILFFWVARMMMLGEWLTGREPFSVVYLSGLVRDPYGQKMSKTKGNVIDPLAHHGRHRRRRAALRPRERCRARAPTSASRRPTSTAPATSPTSSGTRRASCWAPRPAELPADAALSLPEAGPPRPRRALDPVALRRSPSARRRQPTRASSSPRPARILHAAIWSEYCDWYLEMAKVRLGGDGARGHAGGHVAGARLGARSLPAHAPPGHAAHHRGDLGPPAAPARRRRPAHHGRLAGPARTELGR